MWNVSKHEIPESKIFAEHIRVLEEAVANAEEFPVDTKKVQDALNYFEAKRDRQGGINLFYYGMRYNRIDCMAQGLALLKKHLGYSR